MAVDNFYLWWFGKLKYMVMNHVIMSLRHMSYDVIVIGGGLAGYYSAKTLKQGGKSVALVEKMP